MQYASYRVINGKPRKVIVKDGKIYWDFSTRNRYKEEIEIYYFVAFNEDWTKLEHV